MPNRSIKSNPFDKGLSILIALLIIGVIIGSVFLVIKKNKEHFDPTITPEMTEPSTTTPEMTEPATTTPEMTEPTTTTPGITDPTTTPGMTGPTTTPGMTDPTTTPGMTGPTTTSGMTGLTTTTPGMTRATTTSGMTRPTTTTTGSSSTIVPQTTQMNRALDANSYKLSTTNLYQKKFEGASNVYSPYIYVKEPYGVSNDMDNFTHL
jgi:hypothetical protein